MSQLTPTFKATIAHVEELHAEANKLVMQHTRLRQDLESALELADQAMKLTQVEQTVQESDAQYKRDGSATREVAAAAALVDKCSRLQALCYDLLTEVSSPKEYKQGLAGEDEGSDNKSEASRSGKYEEGDNKQAQNN